MTVDADRSISRRVKEKDLYVLSSSSWVVESKQVIAFSLWNVASLFQACSLQVYKPPVTNPTLINWTGPLEIAAAVSQEYDRKVLESLVGNLHIICWHWWSRLPTLFFIVNGLEAPASHEILLGSSVGFFSML